MPTEQTIAKWPDYGHGIRTLKIVHDINGGEYVEVLTLTFEEEIREIIAVSDRPDGTKA